MSALLKEHPRPLNRDEARKLVAQINTGLTDIRHLLKELFDGEGWRVLGYDSWRSCVVAEFKHSATHLYRLLEAAVIEQNIRASSPNGDVPDIMPESHTRALSGLEATQQAEVYQIASRRALGRLTAQVLGQVRDELHPRPQGRDFSERESGRAASNDYLARPQDFIRNTFNLPQLALLALNLIPRCSKAIVGEAVETVAMTDDVVFEIGELRDRKFERNW